MRWYDERRRQRKGAKAREDRRGRLSELLELNKDLWVDIERTKDIG
jgi:hypothetical protein